MISSIIIYLYPYFHLHKIDEILPDVVQEEEREEEEENKKGK